MKDKAYGIDKVKMIEKEIKATKDLIALNQ
jgi:hypothetical protein